MHVYFLRCAAAAAAGLTDGRLCDPATKAPAQIDAKTITGNLVEGHYTGSLIVCAPTPNYEWLPGRSLMELGVSPMSPALLDRRASKGAAGGSGRANRSALPM